MCPYCATILHAALTKKKVEVTCPICDLKYGVGVDGLWDRLPGQSEFLSTAVSQPYEEA